MKTQAPRINLHRANTAFLQGSIATHRARGDLVLANIAFNAARAYRLTLPAQSIIGA